MSTQISAGGRVDHPPNSPAFDVVLLLHVAAVVVGLGAVVVSGIQAARLYSIAKSGHGARVAEVPASVREYFAPGVNWVGRVLYAVPVFGFALLGLSRGRFGVDQPWVLAGLALWAAATGVAEWLHWPAERRIQVLLGGDGEEHRWAEVGRTCRAVCVTATGLVVLLLAAIVLMVSRP
jgi:hypothetical protein